MCAIFAQSAFMAISDLVATGVKYLVIDILHL